MQNSDSFEQAKKYFLSGLDNLNNNNLVVAEVDFQASLKFLPNRLSTIINLTIVLIKLNKFDTAGILINEALINHPKNEELLMGLVEIYEKLIYQNPNCVEVYVNLGNSYKELGLFDESLEAYNKAIILNPNLIEVYNSRGGLLHDFKKYPEALEDFEKAIAIKPDYSDAILNRTKILEELKFINKAFPANKNLKKDIFNYANIYLERGNILKDLNRLEESIASFDKAIVINPSSAEAYSNRGIALRELSRIDEAIDSYNKAIEINPNYAEAFSNRGIALRELNRLDEALASFECAIQIMPNNVHAITNRGNTLKDLNRLDEALASYNLAININPNFDEAYYNLGIYYCDLKNFELALANYDQAIELNPEYVNAYSNRGNILKELKRFQESIESYITAIKLKPDYAEAYSNLAILYNELQRYDEALVNYNKAIAIKPDFADAYFNKSILLLSLQDFENGWIFYNWRSKINNNISSSIGAFPSKSFNLKSSDNERKKILIYGEQGVGDQILFSSMLEQLFDIAPLSQIMLDKRLLALFKRSFPQGRFIENLIISQNTDFDEYLSISDLGQFFRTCSADFHLYQKSFLRVDQDRANHFRKTLIGGKKYLCGITWSSNKNTIGADKSVQLEDLLPILKINHICFVNLQYGDVQEQLADFNKMHALNIKDCSDVDNFNDLDGHASLIQSCDFVISISNTTAHISGAIGKETYLLCPSGKGLLWYWCNRLDGKSLWYPSIHIYEQSQIGNWFDVVQRVKFEIENKIDLNV